MKTLIQTKRWGTRLSISKARFRIDSRNCAQKFYQA